jgi:hypothetical protein
VLDIITLAVVVFLIGLCAVVIWLLQSHSNALRHLAHQNQQLQTVLNDLRKTQAQHSTSLQKIDRLSAQIATTAQPSANPPHPASTTVQVDQRSTYDPVDEPRLNLEPKDTGNTISLSTEDLINALNFPQHANDTTGFGLLRRALKDQNSAQLVIAAQDILTLMSQDAIYMDDLPPERAPADLWRQFAQGARGGEMDALGGIRDQDVMEKVSMRMKTDPIFRDAAHHFLRLFDRNLSKIAQSASDADISALANTRTARAFMILGRAMGTFQ